VALYHLTCATSTAVTLVILLNKTSCASGVAKSAKRVSWDMPCSNRVTRRVRDCFCLERPCFVRGGVCGERKFAYFRHSKFAFALRPCLYGFDCFARAFISRPVLLEQREHAFNFVRGLEAEQSVIIGITPLAALGFWHRYVFRSGRIPSRGKR
jgi:hypothetical protein